MTADTSPASVASVTATSDTDQFMLAVPGASGSLVRTGRGSAQTSVISQVVGPAHLALLDFRFPMVGTAEAERDALIVCQMLRTPPGGRWDGTDLSVGQAFVYPPGSSQTAIDPDGLRFGMVVVPWDAFEEAATALGLDPEPATRQHVRAPTPTSPLAPILAPLVTAPGPPTPLAPLPFGFDRVLEATVRTVCAPPDPRPRARGRCRWESIDLVREASELLDASGAWHAPVLSLCRHVGVSERRLELAFQQVYGVTPQAFMRHRALQAAHEALLAADPATARVSTIAAAHGFFHGGRFSAYHRATFGEVPSATLQTARGRLRGDP